MFLWFMQPDIWLTLVTLIFLEIVPGMDNIIFLLLVVAKPLLSQQNMARKLGLSCVTIMWMSLLISITWLSHTTQPFFTAPMLEILFRILILPGGGLFLIYKAIREIREELSLAQEDEYGSGSWQLSLYDAIVQTMLLDIVFSLDSVTTAVDLSQHIFTMTTAVMIAAGVMMFAAKATGDFVNATPPIKILALTFSSFVGVLLVIDSLNIHTAKEYLYFTMFFSLSVETLNIIRERKNKKVPTLLETHEPYSH